MTFLGRSTSVGQAYTPTDVPPDLTTAGDPRTGQNKCSKDVDFHTKICRVTDYTAMSSLGSGFNTGSGGDVQNWAADESGYIVYTAGGGQPILMSFTPATMASSASDIGGLNASGDCTAGVGSPYFGTGCKAFVTGNISYSPSSGSVMFEMDLSQAPTHLYLNQLALNETGPASGWTFTRTLLFDFQSSTHCMPNDFDASYLGSFNISADGNVFWFAFGDNGQNGQRDFTITGSITSGTFTKGETLIQGTTGATTVVDTCGAVACTSPFAIRAYTGSPDNSHTWVGQSSGAIFTPTGLPVLQHYGASFLAGYSKLQTGCRVLKTFGPGTDGFGPMVVDGDWGPTGSAVFGTNQQATTCNNANTGQTPNCYPTATPVGTSQGPTILDTMALHNGGPTNDSNYVVFSGSDIQSCTTIGGRPTCYCSGPNLCEAYTWESPTLNVRPNLPEGHNVRGSLGAYKGTNYAFFTYHDPYIKLSNLLTVTIPVDQHGTPTNLNSLDQQPIAFGSSQPCGSATGPGNQVCDTSYGILSGVTGNYPYYDEFVAVENQGAYCSSNPPIGPACLTPPAQHCNYGGGANTAACAYRFGHTFNSGTNWNFSTQNAIANISPDGRFAMVASDWFPTGSATDGLNRGFGCTNGDDGITAGHRCLPNLDANGKGTLYSTSASKSGTTITFISTGMVPTVGAKLTVAGFVAETRYNATWTVATSPGSGVWTTASTATAFASDSGGTANWDCGNGALASTPCPRGDIVVYDLLHAGTVF